MRQLLKKGLAILDGQPTGMRGQSLVEMTVTLPIFLIMLLGLVEVGWFANNYLIMSDVVRSAGRYGSLRDPLDAAMWQTGYSRSYEQLDCDDRSGIYSVPGDTEVVSSARWNEANLSAVGYGTGSETPSGTIGYYDGVACTALRNMAPLQLDDERDDIIVSVFSYAFIQVAGESTATTSDDQYNVRVTGRYPFNSNECSTDTRDPFERPSYLDADVEWPFVIEQDGGQEGIRGYVFRGNHKPSDDDGCVGSEFSLQWMEDRLEETLTDIDREAAIEQVELRHLANYGLVLVEISWHSDQLLGIPMFTWVGDPILIHAWSLFPVSAAEPDVEFE